MGIELEFAPVDHTRTITVDELLDRLLSAGLPAKLEPEADGLLWVVFDDFESAMLASVDDNRFIFGTLHLGSAGCGSLDYRFEAVLREAGYSPGDESQFEYDEAEFE